MSFNIPFKSGGGLPQLAPDLTYPADKDGLDLFKKIIVATTAGVPSVFVSLTGKYALSFLRLSSNNCSNFKLTIDGVDIWDDQPSVSTTNNDMLGSFNEKDVSILCKETIIIELTFSDTTNNTLDILARPIL
jgi:hypothetical protein